MLRRIVQFLIATSVILISSTAFSGGYYNNSYYANDNDDQSFTLQPNLKTSSDTEDEDYAHTAKDAYVYAGYVFTYRFLNQSNQTITDHAGNPTVSYPVEGNTPKDFHSVEIGIAKAVSRYVDIQLAYVQEFRQTETSNINGQTSKNSVSMQGLDVNALWIFNPDDRIQVAGKMGVRVADFREKVLLDNTAYYPVDDTTEINPRFGMDFNFQLSPDVAFRLGATYTISAYRVFYDGSIEAFAGLSYKL